MRSGEYAYSHIDTLNDVGELHVHLNNLMQRWIVSNEPSTVMSKDQYIAARILSSIGWAEKSHGTFLDEAMDSHRRFSVGEDHITLGIAYYVIGEVLAFQGQFDESKGPLEYGTSDLRKHSAFKLLN